MKYLLIILLFASCQQNTTTASIKDSTLLRKQTESSNYLQSKAIAERIIDNVIKADRKKITRKQLDKETMPLQNRLDSLQKHLSADEVKLLNQHRGQYLNKKLDSLDK